METGSLPALKKEITTCDLAKGFRKLTKRASAFLRRRGDETESTEEQSTANNAYRYHALNASEPGSLSYHLPLLPANSSPLSKSVLEHVRVNWMEGSSIGDYASSNSSGRSHQTPDVETGLYDVPSDVSSLPIGHPSTLSLTDDRRQIANDAMTRLDSVLMPMAEPLTCIETTRTSLTQPREVSLDDARSTISYTPSKPGGHAHKGSVPDQINTSFFADAKQEISFPPQSSCNQFPEDQTRTDPSTLHRRWSDLSQDELNEPENQRLVRTGTMQWKLAPEASAAGNTDHEDEHVSVATSTDRLARHLVRGLDRKNLRKTQAFLQRALDGEPPVQAMAMAFERLVTDYDARGHTIEVKQEVVEEMDEEVGRLRARVAELEEELYQDRSRYLAVSAALNEVISMQRARLEACKCTAGSGSAV